MEGIVTDDVGVQDKEWGVILPKDFLGKLEGTCRAEGFRFDRKIDFNII